jgi:hypothetical protein
MIVLYFKFAIPPPPSMQNVISFGFKSETSSDDCMMVLSRWASKVTLKAVSRVQSRSPVGKGVGVASSQAVQL